MVNCPSQVRSAQARAVVFELSFFIMYSVFFRGDDLLPWKSLYSSSSSSSSSSFAIELDWVPLRCLGNRSVTLSLSLPLSLSFAPRADENKSASL